MLRPSVSCRTSLRASLTSCVQADEVCLRFRPSDSRKRQKIVDQVAHALGRLQDHHACSGAPFSSSGGSNPLLKQLGIAGHVAEGRAQVMRDGIGKSFQFLVGGFELAGALRQLPG